MFKKIFKGESGAAGTQALESVILGGFTFIVVRYFITAMITGTDTGSQLFQNLVPLAIAVGVVWAAFQGIFKKGG